MRQHVSNSSNREFPRPMRYLGDFKLLCTLLWISTCIVTRCPFLSLKLPGGKPLTLRWMREFCFAFDRTIFDARSVLWPCLSYCRKVKLLFRVNPYWYLQPFVVVSVYWMGWIRTQTRVSSIGIPCKRIYLFLFMKTNYRGAYRFCFLT